MPKTRTINIPDRFRNMPDDARFDIVEVSRILGCENPHSFYANTELFNSLPSEGKQVKLGKGCGVLKWRASTIRKYLKEQGHL